MEFRQKLGIALVGVWVISLLSTWVWESYTCGDQGILQDIVCKAPDNQRAHLNLGIAYRKYGHIPGAVHEFEMVRQLSKKNGVRISSGLSYADSAISNEASILMDIGDYVNARTLLQPLANKGHIPSQLDLDVILIRTGHYQEALSALTLMESQSLPESLAHAVQLNMVEVMTALGKCDEARSRLKKIRMFYPDYRVKECSL